MLSTRCSGQQELHHDAGWSIPAPGRCMHMLRRAMASGGVVGALHVFLCFFHAAFWQEGEQ